VETLPGSRPSSRTARTALLSPDLVLVCCTLLAAAGCLGLASFLGQDLAPGEHLVIFDELFLLHEPFGALLMAAIALSALLLGRALPDRAEGILDLLSRRPGFFIACYTGLLAAAAVIVYHRYPLSMDEYAPLFQSQAFAAGSLTGKVPPELVARVAVPARGAFLAGAPDGRIVSTYWPGFALLLVPFSALRVPWLLNPLLGGATLVALFRLARRMFPGTHAPGWALLLSAASPALSANSISYYSMSAHLLASLVFVALLMEPTPRRALLAGLVGSLALLLHNPVPHAAFAVPWIAWLCMRPRPLRTVAALAVGYLPGLLLGIGWLALRSSLGSASAAGLASSGASAAFAFPDKDLLVSRLLGLAKLVLWAVPGLVPLAVYGSVRLRKNTPVALLVLSFVLTFVAYCFVPFSQGHGWGFRYLHSAWAILPLAGAGVLAAAPVPQRLGRLMLVAAALSLVFCTGLRFVQIHGFIAQHLAQLPPPSAPREVVFVRGDRGYYSLDLVQDDPFLRNPRLIFASEGKARDDELVMRLFPGARPAQSTGIASAWALPPRAVP
jgi:hypothetical protein